MKILQCFMGHSTGFRAAVAFILVGAHWCSAQAHDPDSAPPTAATLYGTDSPDGHPATSASLPATTSATSPDPGISPALAKQLAAMQAEIDALKAELKSRDANLSTPTAAPASPAPGPSLVATPAEPSPTSASNDADQARSVTN